MLLQQPQHTEPQLEVIIPKHLIDQLKHTITALQQENQQLNTSLATLKHQSKLCQENIQAKRQLKTLSKAVLQLSIRVLHRKEKTPLQSRGVGSAIIQRDNLEIEEKISFQGQYDQNMEKDWANLSSFIPSKIESDIIFDKQKSGQILINIDNLKLDLQQKNNTIDSYQQKLRKRDNKIQQLVEKIENKQLENDILKRKVSLLIKEVLSTPEQIRLMNDWSIQPGQWQYNPYEKLIENLQKRIKKLESDKDQTEVLLRNERNIIEDFRTKIIDRQAIIKGYAEERESLLNSFNNKIKEAEFQLKQKQSALQLDYQNRIKSLQGFYVVSQSFQAVQELKKKVQLLQKENKSLATTVQQMKDLFNSLSKAKQISVEQAIQFEIVECKSHLIGCHNDIKKSQLSSKLRELSSRTEDLINKLQRGHCV